MDISHIFRTSVSIVWRVSRSEIKLLTFWTPPPFPHMPNPPSQTHHILNSSRWSSPCYWTVSLPWPHSVHTPHPLCVYLNFLSVLHTVDIHKHQSKLLIHTAYTRPSMNVCCTPAESMYMGKLPILCTVISLDTELRFLLIYHTLLS